MEIVNAPDHPEFIVPKQIYSNDMNKSNFSHITHLILIVLTEI